MIKRSPTKPVRVVPPMMEEQEVSTITLQEWLDREETVSHLLFCKGKEAVCGRFFYSGNKEDRFFFSTQQGELAGVCGLLRSFSRSVFSGKRNFLYSNFRVYGKTDL